MRLIGYRWPIKRGMGVYLRTSNASPTDPTYENITPYVEFEPDDAPATLELGAASRLLRSDAYGNLVTASPNVQQTPWLEYTPTWTGSGGNPSIGNGTIKGYYKRDGTTLYLRGRIIMGSTTTYGTGEWRVSLPSSASTAGATSEYQVGAGMAVDTGTRSYGVYPVSDPGVSATVLRLFYESSADSIQASVTATTPHTWANTDEQNLTGYSASMTVRDSTDATIVSLTTVNSRITLGGSAGTITLTIPAANTATLTPGTYDYDLTLTSGGGTITRLIEGVFTVSEAETQV
jgi:hypothetical protein